MLALFFLWREGRVQVRPSLSFVDLLFFQVSVYSQNEVFALLVPRRDSFPTRYTAVHTLCATPIGKVKLIIPVRIVFPIVFLLGFPSESVAGECPSWFSIGRCT